jgi:hypothetical protein
MGQGARAARRQQARHARCGEGRGAGARRPLGWKATPARALPRARSAPRRRPPHAAPCKRRLHLPRRSLPHAGAIVCEGPEADVQEYLGRIRSLKWQVGGRRRDAFSMHG